MGVVQRGVPADRMQVKCFSGGSDGNLPQQEGAQVSFQKVSSRSMGTGRALLSMEVGVCLPDTVGDISSPQTHSERAQGNHSNSSLLVAESPFDAKHF